MLLLLDIPWPDCEEELEPEEKSLIISMLKPTPTKRATVKEIKSHPFFINNKIDWQRIKDEDGPFVPQPDNLE
eukprot:Pgem_evm1s15854